MSKKLYRFNEHNVCLNPDSIYIGKYIRIDLAEYDGTWFAGLHYEFTHVFYGSPCAKSKENYPTKNEALKNAIKKLISMIDKSILYHRDSEFHRIDVKSMRTAIKELKQYLFDMTHVQLSLF